ncbi:hypothetical protein HYS54_05000, partial [Candidatus Micrarchaeota archaeon]|nr:hypothetical protein [Candidatus Micrarchaeota archaeon]
IMKGSLNLRTSDCTSGDGSACGSCKAGDAAAIVYKGGGIGNQPPVVKVTQPGSCAAGSTCTFTAEASDPDGSVSGVSWTCDYSGDGRSCNQLVKDDGKTLEVTPSGTQGGRLFVSVTAKDDKGSETTASASLDVGPLPVADLAVTSLNFYGIPSPSNACATPAATVAVRNNGNTMANSFCVDLKASDPSGSVISTAKACDSNLDGGAFKSFSIPLGSPVVGGQSTYEASLSGIVFGNSMADGNPANDKQETTRSANGSIGMSEFKASGQGQFGMVTFFDVTPSGSFGGSMTGPAKGVDLTLEATVQNKLPVKANVVVDFLVDDASIGTASAEAPDASTGFGKVAVSKVWTADGGSHTLTAKLSGVSAPPGPPACFTMPPDTYDTNKNDNQLSGSIKATVFNLRYAKNAQGTPNVDYDPTSGNGYAWVHGDAVDLASCAGSEVRWYVLDPSSANYLLRKSVSFSVSVFSFDSDGNLKTLLSGGLGNPTESDQMRIKTEIYAGTKPQFGSGTCTESTTDDNVHTFSKPLT